MSNENYMYAVLCESDCGLDAFGNPIGKPILLERVGGSLSKQVAIAEAEKIKASGKFGDVKVVKLEVCNDLVGWE